MSNTHTIKKIDELVINGTTFFVNREDMDVTVEQDVQNGHVVSERVVARIDGEIYAESGTELFDFITPAEGAHDDD